MASAPDPAASDDRRAPRDARGEGRVVEGLGAAPGIAIGPAHVYAREAPDAEAAPRLDEGDDAEAEVARFEDALARTARDLDRVVAVTREKLGADSAAIFEAQKMILSDDSLLAPVRARIRDERQRAAFAVRAVMKEHRRRLDAADTAYLRERASDLLDVEDRIVANLRRGQLTEGAAAGTIVVASSLGAADVIRFAQRGILGCATDHGGATSHVSIIARALGIPAVASTHDASQHVRDGDTVILDGLDGRLVVRPTPSTLAFYEERRARYQRLVEEQREIVPLPCATRDGRVVTLRANVEFKQEFDLLTPYGAEGIGLLRTEMLFLLRAHISLTEGEQLAAYRAALDAAAPHLATVRLLDFGGDKVLPLAHREHNPFLGWRGIRVLFDRPELLRPQVRALLRAAAHGPVRMLLPMIAHLGEVERFRALVREVRAELAGEGHATGDVPLGIMVEVPSVALQAARFAEAVDFFSIGTNDLTQYTLAVDRGNERVAAGFDALHPAVLQLIHRTVEAAHAAGTPVSLCGEVASDPAAVPVLVGLGLDALSAPPTYLPAVKRVIRALTQDEAERLAARALDAPDAAAVRALLADWLADHDDLALPLGLYGDGATHADHPPCGT